MDVSPYIFYYCCALLLVSFFKKEDSVQLREEMEEIMLDLFHENNKLKKRLSQIEAELDLHSPEERVRKQVLPTTQHQVVKLYSRGQSKQEIAETLNLSLLAVENIIQSYIAESTN